MEKIKDFFSKNWRFVLIGVLVIVALILVILIVKRDKKDEVKGEDVSIKIEGNYPVTVDRDSDGMAKITVDGSYSPDYKWEMKTEEIEGYSVELVSEKDNKSEYKMTVSAAGDYPLTLERNRAGDALDIVCEITFNLNFSSDENEKIQFEYGKVNVEEKSGLTRSGEETAAVKYNYFQDEDTFWMEIYSENNEYFFENSNSEKLSEDLFFGTSEKDGETRVIKLKLTPADINENCETEIGFKFIHVDVDALKKEYEKYKNVTDYTGIKGKNYRGEELEGVEYVLYLETTIERYTEKYQNYGEEAFKEYEFKAKVKYTDGVFTVEQL